MPRPQSLSGRVRNFANLSKPDIRIQLGDESEQNRNYINSYSTGDKIVGNAIITSPVDFRFDALEISLTGFTKSHVDRIGPAAAVSGRHGAFQLFLKVESPIQQGSIPSDNMLKANESYTVPFSFVVPGYSPGSCKHTTNTPHIKDCHQLLPPSLGDPEMAGRGSQFIDDCTPDMCRISYAIRLRMLKVRASGDRRIILAEKLRRVRIVPGYDEQPPVAISETDEDYCLRVEKVVRKGMLRSKIGRVAIEATQPKSLHLPKPDEDPTGATTMASVQLRFDPTVENAEPPKLGQLITKLRIGTFYASTPRAGIPTGKSQIHDATQGLYVDVCQLSSRTVSAIEWHKHDPASGSANVRRDSAMSIIGGSGDSPGPTDTYDSAFPFYTGQILIPISPPRTKILVPSFNYCLVSRIYILELTVKFPQAASATLKVPFQITSEGGAGFEPEFLEELQDEVQDLEQDESVGQYLSPRRMSSPGSSAPPPRRSSPPTRRRSDQDAPPPEYSSLAPRAMGTPQSGNTSASNLYQRLSRGR